MTEFERILEFSPAFDKRDPNPSKNYGIGGLRLFACLVGPLGAVQFKVTFPIYLPGAMSNNSGRDPREPLEIHRAWGGEPVAEETMGVFPTDLGYHSYKPRYDGQSSMGPCEILDGAECWYDGSTLNAMKPFGALVAGGNDGLFEYLEGYYNELFVDGDA